MRDIQSSSSSLLSQDMRSLDLRGSSLCFCQDSSPTSWLITWRYPWLLIGSFCQQMTPRRMATRRKSRQPATARLMITSEKEKKMGLVVAQSVRLVFILAVFKNTHLYLSLLKALDTPCLGLLK